MRRPYGMRPMMPSYSPYPYNPNHPQPGGRGRGRGYPMRLPQGMRPPMPSSQAPHNSTLPAPVPGTYAQEAQFRGGRMMGGVRPGTTPQTHWEKKGLAPDRAGRQ